MGRKKEKPPASKLLEDPLITDDGDDEGGMATPFDRAFGVLTSTTGARLELMTRTTPKLAAAVNVGYNMMFNYRSMYLRGKIDTLMRIHVSMGGKGRAEMVQSLQAGSGVTDGFYESGNPATHSFLDVGGEDDPDGE